MKFRILMNLVLSAVCVAALWSVVAQRRELDGLRAEKQRLLDRNMASSDSPAPAAETPVNASNGLAIITSSSPELLRLRNEVSQLMARERGFAGVSNENDRLRVQVAARATNAPGELPPGYILRSKAQWVGFNTPESTIQTFLWAAQNRDITNLLQALTPDTAKKIQAQLQQKGGAADEFFQGMAHFPGMRVVERQPQPDGSIELKVEIVPGMENQPLRARFIDGQWKLDLR